MPHLIAVLPSLARCASLLAGELERIPVSCRRSTPATSDAEGINFWTVSADHRPEFAFAVSPSDLRKHLSSLALDLAV